MPINRHLQRSIMFDKSHAIESIGKYAFSGCKKLKNIIIPQHVSSLEEEAFRACESLKVIDIPQRVEKIEQYAFSDCISLEKVVIPQKVGVLDDCVFQRCANIREVELPENITSINRHAFSKCEKLEEITIPDSVKIIGSRAFEKCSSLESIIVPDSVVSFSASIFAGCTNLKKVVLPNTIEELGYGVFYGCKKLDDVNMPISLKSIDSQVFHGCLGLTKLVFPRGLEIINEYAFEGCANIKSITVCKSVVEKDSNGAAFARCSKLSDIYFEGTEDEWNSNFTKRMGRHPTIHYNSENDKNNIEHITTTSNNNIEIHAYDIEDGTALGKPMKDAAVNVDKFGNARTDADGKAVIDNNLTDQPLVNTKLSITKEGYREYYFYKDIYNRDAELLWENNQQTVWMRKLQEKDRSNPYISTLMCQTSYGKIYDAMNYREVYQSKGGTQNIKLQMNAVWNGKKPDSYILYQENGVSYTSTDGKFSLDMGKDFEAKYPIYAKLVAEDGTSVTEKTSIEIAGSSSTAKPGNTLDLINTDSTGTLGEDIAFLSGQDFSIKMGGAKLDFSVEKGIIKATIGKNKKISEGGYGAKDWEEWKALCENEPSDLNLMSQWKDAIENIDTGWTDDLKGKTEVYGYLEGAINNSGSTMLTGKIKLKTSIDSGMQAQYMIGVIPVYIKVSYGAKGGVEIALVYNWTEKKIDAEKSGVTLSLEPYLAAEGGVGVMAVAEVGVEGKGSMPFSTKLGTNDETKLSLKGTLSLKAKLLIFEYSLKLAEAELKLLPIEQPQSIAQAAGISELSMNDFKLSDSHYLEKESLWLGNSAIQPFSLETTETGAAERVLKTNINPDADMQMVTAGDTKMILWTEGDPKRASINNSKLVYSIYNAADDTWSAPEAVADDGTADFAPSVVSDGERIYAAWQNINREFTNDAALSEVAAASTAVMSVWTAGEGFSDAVTVSEAGCMAVMPKIALNADGKPYVAYLQNTDNNLLLTTDRIISVIPWQTAMI